MEIASHDIILAVTTTLSLIIGSGGVVAYFRLRSDIHSIDAGANKTEAETTRVIVEMWETLYKQLEKRVAELETTDREKTQQIKELEDEVDDLRAWIEKQGLTPPPRRNRRSS